MVAFENTKHGNCQKDLPFEHVTTRNIYSHFLFFELLLSIQRCNLTGVVKRHFRMLEFTVIALLQQAACIRINNTCIMYSTLGVLKTQNQRNVCGVKWKAIGNDARLNSVHGSNSMWSDLGGAPSQNLLFQSNTPWCKQKTFT